MLYINDPNQQYKTYDDLVNLAINTGIKPKRAYIYLASMGIKGATCRVLDNGSMTYLQPFKIAVRDDKTIVKSASICEHCKGLTIE
jgi:hypothetical protein